MGIQLGVFSSTVELRGMAVVFEDGLPILAC
jgi:hypothetical protein